MDLETTNMTIDVIINEAVLNKLAKTIDKMLKDVCSRLKNVPEDEREFSKDTIFINVRNLYKYIKHHEHLSKYIPNEDIAELALETLSSNPHYLEGRGIATTKKDETIYFYRC